MRHRILAAILDFVKETEKCKKTIYTNSPGPVCILQIFGNNPSRGFRVRAETSGGGGQVIHTDLQIVTFILVFQKHFELSKITEKKFESSLSSIQAAYPSLISNLLGLLLVGVGRKDLRFGVFSPGPVEFSSGLQ